MPGFILFLVLLIPSLIGVLVHYKKKEKAQNEYYKTLSDAEQRTDKSYQQSSNNSSYFSKAIHEGYDTQNLPSSLSSEERQVLCDIAARYHVRYVTQVEIQRNIIDNLNDDFSKMPGWNMWDFSIHRAPGQFERAERGSHIADTCIAEYDPDAQLARVIGESGTYLTSYRSCSCPDFRKRHLPCKHMYALAMMLDGDITKRISADNQFPLLGLSFATAGRFPKDQTGKTTKDKIATLGGDVSESVSFYSSALVLGNNPSENKIRNAKEYDMEILTADKVLNLFQVLSTADSDDN